MDNFSSFVKEHVAHLGQPEPHLLSDHLTKVGEKAASFASSFNGAYWAKLIGLWHDLGKYNSEFQEYIRKVSINVEDAHLGDGKPKRGPNHSSAGALYALEWLKQQLSEKIARDLVPLLAYPIMGHHAGLTDYALQNGGLDKRLYAPEEQEHLNLALKGMPPEHILLPQMLDVKTIGLECLKDGRDIGFFIRMLFSCLVDADFLDTEKYMSPEKTEKREPSAVSLETLRHVLITYLKTLAIHSSPINTARTEILSACFQKATEKPGFFSLAVPTGGGKTLSSLAFALSHATQYNKRRIIYAIPYTSIIEQTAQVFKEVFSAYPNTVIEHHSNISDVESDRETNYQRLASENWDAQIIVTTTVQLFESLHASRTSRCRKLHNIAESVLILDEAHLMPPDLREPILFSLAQLVKYYGVSVVLCTATPTGLENLKNESKYIPQLQSIISNTEDLYNRLKRVEVIRKEEVVSNWSELAEELVKYPQVLCIVGRRDDCRDLHEVMPKDTIHLSALMCAEHRTKVIADIKHKLKNKESVRVISTQLVEAGVDMDFPIVYRAMAGLDSIAQAAGRCNREGKLDGLGKVVIFYPKQEPPKGTLIRAYQAASEVLRLYPGKDLLLPDLQREYFKFFYGRVNGDKKSILRLNERFRCKFKEMAEEFKMVENVYKSIIVHYNNADLLMQIMAGKPKKWLLRKAQRYVVSIPEGMVKELINSKAIKEVLPGLYIQDITYALDLYDEAIGLKYEGNKYASEDLIV